jgi:hypothetical protein
MTNMHISAVYFTIHCQSDADPRPVQCTNSGPLFEYAKQYLTQIHSTSCNSEKITDTASALAKATHGRVGDIVWMRGA